MCMKFGLCVKCDATNTCYIYSSDSGERKSQEMTSLKLRPFLFVNEIEDKYLVFQQ